jgi:hypothetical protein
MTVFEWRNQQVSDRSFVPEYAESKSVVEKRKRKYTVIPYSVRFEGDDWEGEMRDFAAACQADLPAFVLIRMIQEATAVLCERSHDEESDPLLNAIAVSTAELSRRCWDDGDFED